MNVNKIYKDRTFNLNNDCFLGHGFTSGLYPVNEGYFKNLLLIMPTPYLYVTFVGIYSNEVGVISPTLFYFDKVHNDLEEVYNDLVKAEKICLENKYSAIILDKDYKVILHKREADSVWYFYKDDASDMKPPSYNDVHKFYKDVSSGAQKILFIANNLKVINSANLGYFAAFIMPTFISIYFNINDGEKTLSRESINFFYHLCCRQFSIKPLSEIELNNALSAFCGLKFPNFADFKFRKKIKVDGLLKQLKPKHKQVKIDDFIPYYLKNAFLDCENFLKFSTFLTFADFPNTPIIFIVDTDLSTCDANNKEIVIISREDILFIGIDVRDVFHIVLSPDIESKCKMNNEEIEMFIFDQISPYGYTNVKVHKHPLKVNGG